jgi:hypothetical protein
MLENIKPTEPRDKLYSLLALESDDLRGETSPDYDLLLDTTFMSFRRPFRRPLVESTRELDNIPSWCSNTPYNAMPSWACRFEAPWSPVDHVCEAPFNYHRPGAQRETPGNITTGIPFEENGKAFNKNILNGAMSWTRDLMWLKLQQQQQDLANIITDLGGTFPFGETEDERRMYIELANAMFKNDRSRFHYNRERKPSIVSSLVSEVLTRDTKIIDNASIGDIAKVSRLISLGANVYQRSQ